jgi:hypothetical protein
LIASKESAKILKYTSKHVEVETECNNSGFLVLAHNEYLRWKVYDKGSERNVLKGEQSTSEDFRG